MKKLITTFLLMVLLQSAFAQFTKGTVLLGGASSFTFSTTKDTYDGEDDGKSTYFSLSPQAGYFVADNVAIGAGIDLYVDKTEDESGDYENTSSGFVIAPFVRYYLENKLFFQGSFGIGSQKNKTTGLSDFESKNKIFRWGIGVGYAAMVSDKVAIEPMVSYNSWAYKNDDSDIESKTAGLMLGVGVTVYLGGD
jgi:outer membrane protein